LSEYRIFETDEFLRRCKRLEKQSPREAAFLRKKLTDYVYPQLREEPFWGKNVKKLRDYSPEMWRYRIGQYRLFYTVDTKEKIVFLLTVEDRKDAYR
jgi:mRNA interferase RelE/StbE